MEARIGGGGMAIVYKARDLVLNRPVAVKVLRPQFCTDDDFINRFRREAQAVASLSHPNVVSVYDVGQDHDIYYMVMEYIEGSTLKDLINRQGALPVAEAVRIAVQVCDALDHAHQNHIIHRDIKPHNILIGKNGRVKVTDFGIARAVTSATITHTGSVIGSVHYFSPEQARGGITAEKSDIYSLGIVLYEMVTGQVPFSGDSPISVALKHLQDPLPEPRQINPAIPQSVENVILKALVKDPLLRYASAREMLSDLETCLNPERLNEPKVEFPVDDEETRVVPAITPEMLEQARHERQTQHRNHADKERSGGHSRNWWVKSFVWIGAIGLFLLLALVGFNYVTKLFDVPEITVPPVEGTQLELAVEKLKEANLVPKVEYEYNDDKDEGIVFRQDPAPPMRVKENATVTLYVSKGPHLVSMPNLIGLTRDAADEQLKGLQFRAEFTEQEDEKAPAGQVIAQDPPANTSVVPSKTVVRVTVSKGRKYVKMPSLVGFTLDRARFELLKAGLAVGPITEEPSYKTQEAGIVISTHPYDANMDVPAGKEIPLTVSNGQYPADAKVGSYPVIVEVQPGVKADIRILVSDARGEKQVAFQETITQSTEYKVPLVLSPAQNGTIEVLINGQPYQNYTIDYKNFP